MKSRAAVSKTLAPPPSESEEDAEEDEDEDDSEDDDEDDEPTPAPNRIRRVQDNGRSIREAARRVAEANTFAREDSIIAPSDDEDADEVDDLL
jgi:hypothetical protein